MELIRDLAIVLRSIPYEERHRIVTALTENHGQITALARNSIQSRRFGGTLEVFSASEWTFGGREHAEFFSLREAQIKRSFEGLRKDFERLSMASVFNEIMLRIAPRGQASSELFRLHSNALAALEESEGVGADIRLLNGYLAKVLQWNGNHPQLLACLSCQKPLENMPSEEPLTCVIADAGWICPSCRAGDTHHVRARSGEGLSHALLRVPPLGILDFHVALAFPIRQFPKAAQAPLPAHRELFRFLEALLIYHVPGFDRNPLKGLRFLDLESSPRLP